MAFYSYSDRIETTEPSDYDDNLPSFVEELIKNTKRPLSTFRTALKEYEESEYKAFASPFESGESIVDCICEIGGGEENGLKYLHQDTFVSCFEDTIPRIIFSASVRRTCTAVGLSVITTTSSS